MILIKEYNQVIENPIKFQDLSPEIKNHLVNVMDKGEVFFKFPKDFTGIKNENKHRNIYKIGFLYDMLAECYPSMSKTDKYVIISNEYQFFFTYRRFKDVLDEYINDKRKYYKNRSLL